MYAGSDGFGNSTIYSIDSKTNKVISNFSLTFPVLNSMIVEPSNGLVYINEFNSSIVEVWDPLQKIGIRNITVPCLSCLQNITENFGLAGIGGMAIDDNLGILYVTELGTTSILHILDTAGLNEMDTIFIPSANTIEVNPETNLVYVADSESDTIFVLDGYTHTIYDNITNLGGIISDMSIDPNKNIVYAANQDSDTVSIINATTNEIIKEIRVGNSPDLLEINPTTEMLYIPIGDSETMTVVNGTTNNITVGVEYSINPLNAGYIECNGKKITSQENIRYDIGTPIKCTASPNSSFSFDSWSGDFDLDSNEKSTEFTSSKYGNLTASFVDSPATVAFTLPPSTLIQILGIVITAVVGIYIPRIVEWYHNVKQRKYLIPYMNSINSAQKNIQSLGELRNDISRKYSEGKINSSNYTILNERITDQIKNIGN